jgi:putative flippase GtrA
MSKIKKELKRFLVAGLCAVGTDLITYYILLDFLPPDIAKALSFLLGTVVAFVINKYWTFEKHETSYKEMIQFGMLYSLTLGTNVMTNKMILGYTSLVFLAFLVATGVSTVLNFIGQKWWVFK